MKPLQYVISNFENKIIVLLLTKDFFSRSFHSCKFFHKLCKKWNLKGNFIKLSTYLNYGLTEVKKSSIMDVRIGSKYASVNITLHLRFVKRT